MSGSLVTQLLATTALGFLLAVSLLGLALGIGLIARTGAMLSFIHLMNRWVSMRQALRPLEVPRHVAPGVAASRWFAACLIALGAFAAAILVARVGPTALAALFRVDARTSLAGVLLEALHWFLVLGSVAAVATGILLLFFPGTWQRIEGRANRWYSTRELESAGDALHPSLDRIVEAFPRTAGAVLCALSAAGAGAAAALLFGR